jgi:hypothetical protein
MEFKEHGCDRESESNDQQTGEHHNDGRHHDEHLIAIFVDDERLVIGAHELTADEILKVAGLDAADNYLVKTHHGRPGESYEGKGSTVIQLTEHDTFIAVSQGPTPVS